MSFPLFCNPCKAKHFLSFSKENKSILCPDCKQAMSFLREQLPPLIQLAMHSEDIDDKKAAEILAYWEEERKAKKDISLMEVLKNYKGIEKEVLIKLESMNKHWLQRNKDKKVISILAQLKLVKKEDLEEALKIQKLIFTKNKTFLAIGDILVQKGFLKQKQYENLLNALDNIKNTEAKDAALKEDKKDNEVKDQDKKEEEKEEEEEKERANSLDEALGLDITEDSMTAYIQLLRPLPENSGAEDIQNWLYEKGISFGLVDISFLEGFIKFDMVRKSRFKVAEGIPAFSGSDGKLELHFPSDFLTSGAILTEDGSIDFKERGSIPHVEKDALLAEKTPAVQAKAGTDIFGNIVQVEEVFDPPLKAGEGTYTKEEETKIYARVNGQPTLSLNGEVSVIDEIVIDGNVDYETGHVQYEGKVRIRGRILTGFRVEANQVIADSLDGGLILAKGEVIINAGVTEGEIYTEGNVKARFVNKSKIRALGNIIVIGEIIDSDLACSGGCNIKLGNIISSTVAARQGIEVNTIGTEVARGSDIYIGVDLPMQEKLMKIEEKFQKKSEKLKEDEEEALNLENKEKLLLGQITKAAQIQDRSNLKLKLIREERFEEAEVKAGEAKSVSLDLEKAIKDAEAELGRLFEAQDILEREKEKNRKNIDFSTREFEESMQEKKAMERFNGERASFAFLKINKIAYPGTKITGLKSQTVLKNTSRAATIREVEIRGEKTEYLMRIT